METAIPESDELTSGEGSLAGWEVSTAIVGVAVLICASGKLIVEVETGFGVDLESHELNSQAIITNATIG